MSPQVPPKWGDWEGEDNQYTAFFEKARKAHDPKARRKVVDPNNPQQNPYTALAMGQTAVSKKEVPVKDSKRDGNFYAPQNIPGARVHTSYVADSSNGRRSYDRLHKRRGSNASSDISSQSNTSIPWHQIAVRPAKGQHSNNHQKAPSVPPFGVWKENPNTEQQSVAPEEFSGIFNKVREERAGSVSRLVRSSEMHAKREDSSDEKITSRSSTSRKFKMCFCFAA